MTGNVSPYTKRADLFAALFELDDQGIVFTGISDQRIRKDGSVISNRERRHTPVRSYQSFQMTLWRKHLDPVVVCNKNLMGR